MEPNQDIFCTSPWYELHVYWNGDFGICCSGIHKLFDASESQKYNIKNMSIGEWYNSEPVKKLRLDLLGQSKLSYCTKCYNQEKYGSVSRRHNQNQKSVIFKKENFKESVVQSPHYKNFLYSKENQGLTNNLPLDLHIDLGNYCNLACKMCWAPASSRIAVQEVKWGDENAKTFLNNDWTKDQQIWDRFLNEIVNIENLQIVHFMGGETLLSPRFNDFLDFMIDKKRFDLQLQFVSNGTVYNPGIVEKLKKFKRVGFEISIETLTDHNAYARQGTNTEEVISNIKKYSENTNNSNVNLILRTAVSALTIGNYPTLLQFALDNKLFLKTDPVVGPLFMNPKIIPNRIKEQYKIKYLELKETIDLGKDLNLDYNSSDPNEYKRILSDEIDRCMNILSDKTENEDLLKKLVEHCKKWDSVYNYDALKLYPEFKDIFVKNGY